MDFDVNNVPPEALDCHYCVPALGQARRREGDHQGLLLEQLGVQVSVHVCGDWKNAEGHNTMDWMGVSPDDRASTFSCDDGHHGGSLWADDA